MRMIAETNYNIANERGMLVNALQKTIVAWIPVGHNKNGETYRIVPGAEGLLPDQPAPKTNRELVSSNVLGVNTNV